MNLRQILKKFDSFDSTTDCLVMLGEEGRFSFYAPDRYSRDSESSDSLPDHVFITLVFMYLASHPDENAETIRSLREKTIEWLHESKDG